MTTTLPAPEASPSANTHRAVIEDSAPPAMQVIAAGPRDFCRTALDDWLTTHPLTDYQTALILTVEGPQ